MTLSKSLIHVNRSLSDTEEKMQEETDGISISHPCACLDIRGNTPFTSLHVWEKTGRCQPPSDTSGSCVRDEEAQTHRPQRTCLIPSVCCHVEEGTDLQEGKNSTKTCSGFGLTRHEFSPQSANLQTISLFVSAWSWQKAGGRRNQDLHGYTTFSVNVRWTHSQMKPWTLSLRHETEFSSWLDSFSFLYVVCWDGALSAHRVPRSVPVGILKQKHNSSTMIQVGTMSPWWHRGQEHIAAVDPTTSVHCRCNDALACFVIWRSQSVYLSLVSAVFQHNLLKKVRRPRCFSLKCISRCVMWIKP